jgi:hypothetical protein
MNERYPAHDRRKNAGINRTQYREIAQEAYRLFLEDSCAADDTLVYWERAETSVRHGCSTTTPYRL